MQARRSIPHFYTHLWAVLFVICLPVMACAVFVGEIFPSSLISFTVPQTSASYDSGGKLHLLDVRTALTAKVSDHTVFCCTIWSPDGTRIAFSSGELHEELQPFVWDQRDNTTRHFSTSDVYGWAADWSPDNQSLLLVVPKPGEGNQLYRTELGGSQVTRLTFLTNAQNDYSIDIQDVDWSPDGQFIVFAGSLSFNWEIYRISPDGKNLQQLTYSGGHASKSRISPDGQHIAFVVTTDTQTELFFMNPDGSQQQRVITTERSIRNLYWSPDGTRLLFQTSADGIGLLRVADGEQRLLPFQTSFSNDLLSWSPDGTQVLFENWVDGQAKLYVLDVDGTNAPRLIKADFANTFNATWQP